MADEPRIGTDVSTPDDERPVACSLTTEDARDRVAWIEDTLGPDLRDITVEDGHVVWTFDRTADAIEGAAELTAREAQCCAFATLELTVPPEGAVTFRMDVPEGTAPGLLRQFDDALDIEDSL